MSRLEQIQRTTRDTLHRAGALTLVIGLLALALSPVAIFVSGPRGIGELAAAAGICLAAGWGSEVLGAALCGRGGPLAGMLAGMAVRMFPPLVVCGVIALDGARARQYLAFIAYLLTFYLATLAFETWSAIRRVEHISSPSNHGG
jgi:hypothetical protein